jgi:hypothetical protein
MKAAFILPALRKLCNLKGWISVCGRFLELVAAACDPLEITFEDTARDHREEMKQLLE